MHFALFPHMSALKNSMEAPVTVPDLTMTMAAHQMRCTREFADGARLFCQGRTAEAGPPEQLLGEPRNGRSRQFFGAVLEAG